MDVGIGLEGKLGDCMCSADITSCDSEPIVVLVFNYCITIIIVLLVSAAFQLYLL